LLPGAPLPCPYRRPITPLLPRQTGGGALLALLPAALRAQQRRLLCADGNFWKDDVILRRLRVVLANNGLALRGITATL